MCPITEPAIGAAGVTGPASVLLRLVRNPDLPSIGPLSRRSLSIARGWVVPRNSVVGALRTLELLFRHLEQARTSLAALAPAIVP